MSSLKIGEMRPLMHIIFFYEQRTDVSVSHRYGTMGDCSRSFICLRNFNHDRKTKLRTVSILFDFLVGEALPVLKQTTLSGTRVSFHNYSTTGLTINGRMGITRETRHENNFH